MKNFRLVNYSNYVSYKLNQMSSQELINFSKLYNFGQVKSSGYIDRKAKSISDGNNGSASKSEFGHKSEFDHKPDNKPAPISQQKSDTKPEVKPVTKSEPKPAEVKSETKAKTQESQGVKQETKTTSDKGTQQNSQTTKTVKNVYGDPVHFYKGEDGSWYNKSTNEKVGKTGKWRSYFDEKGGVKDASIRKSPGAKIKQKPVNNQGDIKPKANEVRFDKLGNITKDGSGYTKAQLDEMAKSQKAKNPASKDTKSDGKSNATIDVSKMTIDISKMSDSELSEQYRKGKISKYQYNVEMCKRTGDESYLSDLPYYRG